MRGCREDGRRSRRGQEIISTALLDQAEDFLSTPGSLGPHALRAACWLARTALEDGLRQRLRDRSLPADDANTRSMLIALSVAYADEPGISRSADQAWAGLSRASHHHAYELGPSLLEVRELIAQVRTIVSH